MKALFWGCENCSGMFASEAYAHASTCHDEECPLPRKPKGFGTHAELLVHVRTTESRLTCASSRDKRHLVAGPDRTCQHCGGHFPSLATPAPALPAPRPPKLEGVDYDHAWFGDLRLPGAAAKWVGIGSDAYEAVRDEVRAAIESRRAAERAS